MMETITIPKSEYIRLKKISDTYHRFAATVFENNIGESIEDVVKDFHETGLYSKEFLEDLESGLKKSSYNNRK